MNLSPIEALKKIQEIIDKPPYGDSLPNRYSQIAKIATEALAYKGQDEKTFTLDQMSNAYDAGEAAADYDRKRIERKSLKFHYFNTIHSVSSYKAGEDLEQAKCSHCGDIIEHPLCSSCEIALTLPDEEY